ncbi:MAG: cytidylyltransferase [Planctomycetes bacterium]|nr:cytidylyltransferase [Planctomycetota bacterium]
MICALLLGRKGSVGFPGKNTMDVLGKPLMAYPILSAKGSRYIDEVFVSTDCPEIRKIGESYGAQFIERPPELATKTALGEDAYRHGYYYMKENVSANIELLVLLFCNAVTVTSELIDRGIEKLRDDRTIDSAVSVSRYNMWSPLRARKINDGGLLDPYIPFETFGDPKTMNCDRDSQGDVWFADMGVSIVRPGCLENMEEGLLPQKWMGQRIFPLRQEAGFDLDYEWQVPNVEYWLKKYGGYS